MPKAIMAVLGCAALLTSGCGGGGSYANNPRPAAPLSVSATVAARSISVSPSRIGAGQIRLIVANITSSSQVLTLTPLENRGGGSAAASSGPINPQGTAELTYDAVRGDYRLAVEHGPRAAVLHVGAPRPSAQDQVLLP